MSERLDWAAPSIPSLEAVARPWPKAQEIWGYLMLMKPKKVAMLVFAAGSTAVVAGGGAVLLDRVAWLLLTGGMASAGACTLNHYLDRDIDAVMARTRRRPFPSGLIQTPVGAAVLGILLVALSIGVSLRHLGQLATLFIFLGAFLYVVVYTAWLKRRSSFNIVVGGMAGSCAALAGWTAINPQITPAAVLLGLLIFLWTPSHFWGLAMAHIEDYSRAGVPMLPVLVGPQRTARAIFLNSVVLFLASLALYFLGGFGVAYLSAAVFAGVLFLAVGGRMLLSPTRSSAWLNYKVSGPYLGMLFVAMLVDLFVRL